MNLKDILAIGGQPGLYKMLSQAKNNIIVESLTTGKRMPAYATSKISSLGDIAIFTLSEDLPLQKVFLKIFEIESGGPAIDHKSDPQTLVSYMEKILPDYDRDRVYVSDIKKLVQWYNILLEKGLITPEEPETETNEEESANDTPQPAE
ncbi:MAG: DUF5606 domain-containing protein [Bacteroidales bacterium]|jgi:hypothetical protein|nr:DUF5606 domain-containing protein [Bacteroidales bacterium]